jgi:hypothetical protein
MKIRLLRKLRDLNRLFPQLNYGLEHGRTFEAHGLSALDGLDSVPFRTHPKSTKLHRRRLPALLAAAIRAR